MVAGLDGFYSMFPRWIVQGFSGGIKLAHRYASLKHNNEQILLSSELPKKPK
jgi:hypothetical protein